jgi:diguanylate cyclase (GGDEF)-like protein
MIDVDHFKQFNDTFGHDAGDYVLQKIGNLMFKVFRGEDSPCRYGGEEFAIILPGADLESTKMRAADFLETTRKMDLQFGDESLGRITCSIGIAVYPEHEDTANNLIKSADQALYMAKSKGRDRVQVFNEN